MLTIPRAAVRSFRSVARRCPGGRSPGPVPPVRLQSDGQTLTLHWAGPEATLALSVPQVGPAADLLVPVALLDAVEHAHADAVEVEAVSAQAVAIRWTANGSPRREAFDRPRPKAAAEPFAMPTKWVTVPAAFVMALHEAGRTAAREATGRYALDRVQVYADRLVAADGQQALVQGGFALPVTSPVLVPAVPVFAAKEFRGHGVQVGRTPTHLVVQVGPWTVGLVVDPRGKFPDVAAVVPKTLRPTVLTLGEADAARVLVECGPAGPADEAEPVTLDVAAGRVVVRRKVAGGDAVSELVLAASSATGPAVRYPLNPRYLRRALALGFRTLRFAAAGQPVVAADGDRTYLAVGHDPADALSAAAPVPSIETLGRPTVGRSASFPPLEIAPMKNVLNGSAPAASRVEPAAAEDPLDLVAEAEALRAALVEVVQRVTRLAATLKHHRKEKKALTQAWSSLQSLRLGS